MSKPGNDPGLSRAMKRSVLTGVLLGAIIILFYRSPEWLPLLGSLRAGHAAGPAEITGNGIIEATEAEVSTKVTARIASLAVRIGENVRAGQVLALLENEDFSGQLDQAKGALRLAEARLRELEAGARPEEILQGRARMTAAQKGLEQAEARRQLIREGPRAEQIAQLEAGLTQANATLADTGREFRRIAALKESGAAAGQQYDQTKTRWEIAQAQVTTAEQRLAEAKAGARTQERLEADAAVAVARAQLDLASSALDLLLIGPRAEAIEAARGQVDQAKGQVRTAQAMLDYTVLTAPMSGRVTERNLEPGEVVTPGMGIVQIADLDKVWMKVFVPATQVGVVKFGQTAEVVCDSLPGRVFPGTVVEISDTPEFTPKNVQTRDERIKQIFWVKLELDNPRLDLKPGMPGDARIRIP